MEPTTPFDLNRAIEKWRTDLEQSPAFKRENLDELEGHLRDSVVRLRGQGLSAKEAFIIGLERIGSGQALEAQFARVNRKSIWLDRALWMLIGIQVWGLTSGLIDSIASNGFAYVWRTVNHPWRDAGNLPVSLAFFTLAHVMAFAASIGFCWWLIFRKGGKISARLAPWLQRRSALVACGLVLCVVALLVSAFSEVLSALIFRSAGNETVRNAVMYLSYSRLFVTPLQLFAMIAATLVLARRRLRLVTA